MVVYKHVRLDKNEPFYIGIGNLERAYTKRSRNKYWKHIVKSVPYKVEILYEELSLEEACKKEIELIKHYGRKDLGTGILVNMTDGGDLPPNHKGKIRSDEFRKKISDSNKGRKFTQEHINNLSESHKGFRPSEETKNKISQINKGRILTDEWKEKISKSNLGQKRTESAKQKMKENHKGNSGRKFSDEHKLKISEAIKQKYKENPKYNLKDNNGFYGKSHTEETKQKMKDAWAKRKQQKINE